MNWKDALKWIVVILIFVFLFRHLSNSWGDLKDYEFELNLTLFLLSYIFVIVYFVFLALGWGLLLKVLRKPGVPMLKALKIRTISDFGRFVPGKVWLILGRIHLTKKYKIPAEVVTLSALMEVFLNFFGALLLFVFVFLLIVNNFLTNYALLSLPLILLFVFLLHPKWTNIFMKLAAKLLKRKFVKSKVKFGYMLSLVSVFFVSWFILSIGFFLMVYSVYPIPLSYLLPLGGIFAISWMLGCVAFIVPAGLGVREAFLTYFLSFYLPGPVGVLVSLLSRIWFIFGEILAAFIFLWV